MAEISVEGKMVPLGRFHTLKEAYAEGLKRLRQPVGSIKAR
jgi:hypothetical protein